MHVILSKRSRGKKFGDCVTASFFTPFIMMHDIVLTEDWAIHYTPRHDCVTCNTCNIGGANDIIHHLNRVSAEHIRPLCLVVDELVDF